ncbi:hypothetical protein MHYP_G00093950 [Metynnis hypsauchen]
MEDDLERFLRSREVPQEDIMRMQRDKVDKAVISVMTDDQMSKYITSYGDRIAVLSYCQQPTYSMDKETLLQNLRQKIGARKMRSKTKGALCGTSGVLQNQGIDEADTVAWNPEEDLVRTEGDEAVVIMLNCVNDDDLIQDNGLNFIAQDLPLGSSNQLSPSNSAGNPGNPENPQRISVRRCEGETERVPRLRPDFCEAEWQAVGHIWVKGLLDYGVIPVRLSKAFILACIHGIDSVDADILMSSFFNYLLPVERSAVEKALSGTMDESDKEDLLDLFTRMGSHSLPPQNNMQPTIEAMAHKAIIQEPKYIVDCFSTAMACVKLKLSNKESVVAMYEAKKATGKRVSQLFETTKVTLSQIEQTTFNHLQRYVKNADESKAEKILRFCTGSSVICIDKILVCFNAETGLNRRPVAHTCGATLEVPCTYTCYPDFRTEFDNILSSNYLEMDII